MASQLARLLDRRDIQFDIAIKDLEKATGNKNIDVKLIGDILTKAHRIIRSLELDSKDTTAKELYNALRAHSRVTKLDDAMYVGIFMKDKLVSLNHADIAIDKVHKVAFAKRATASMRSELCLEIERRYKAASKVSEYNLEPMFKIIRKTK